MACALLYNFKDAARLQKVRFALFKLGVSGRVVAPEELSQPIGYLCDLEGFSPVEETVEGGFSDEMLVLCGLSGPQLDALLSSLRRSRVVVALKAVVTEDNAAWSSLQLHDELRQEHEAMKGTRPKDAEKRSAHRRRPPGIGVQAPAAVARNRSAQKTGKSLPFPDQPRLFAGCDPGAVRRGRFRRRPG